MKNNPSVSFIDFLIATNQNYREKSITQLSVADENLEMLISCPIDEYNQIQSRVSHRKFLKV